jgi:hypothetical protein
MPTYTVHEPPASRKPERRGPERFVFIRDGFHFWAFVLAPLWMLRHRLWLVFVVYLALSAALTFGQQVLGITGFASALGGLLLSALVGLEAATLRRRKLAWWNWREVGVVTGARLEDAERRFFDAWTEDEIPLRPRPLAPSPLTGFSAPPPTATGTPPHVVGLFPEPGGQR